MKEDGYVSRIKISLYQKIYINHPTGVLVYGHLKNS
jgi:hypothetical protein